MSSRAIQLLTVRIGGDTSEVLAGLDRVSAKAGQMSKNLGKLGSTLTRNLSAPIAAAGAAALAAGIQIGNAADKLLDMEQQTGLTTDALQEFRRVSTVAGVDQDVLAKAAEQMTRRLATGAEGSADLRDGLARLGLSARDAAGNLRPMEEVVNESLGRLADMEDVTQRNVIATKLFSRAATDLAPVLGMGSAEIARAREEAHSMGLVLDREALVAANNFRIQVDTLTASLKAQADRIGLAVIPIMARLVDVVQTNVIPIIARGVEIMGGLDAEMVIVAATVASVVASVGPLVLVGSKLVGVFGLIASPAGLVVAALAAMATTAIVVAKNWDVLALQGTLAWTALKDAVFGALDGILGLLERLPIVGGKVSELRAQFDEFAQNSLVEANDRIAELERRLNANGAAMARLGEAASVAAAGVDQLGASAALVIPEVGAVNEGLLRMHSVELPGVVEGVGEVAPILGRAGEKISAFRQALGDVALDGVEAFAEFATGAGDAIGAFVKRAIADLVKLAAKMLIIRGIMSFLPGVGSFLGFGGGKVGKFAGGFAQGGQIPGGQFGLVGEAGRPEIVSSPTLVAGPANVTPVGDAGRPVVIQFPAPSSAAMRAAYREWEEFARQAEHNGFSVRFAG